MYNVSLFFTVLWCVAKPVLVLVIPALIVGEKYLIKQAID